MLALRQLQLAETATISFLTPIFVALLAGPLLGERVGGERMIAIVVGFVGVLIATRPGTSAFQPIVLVAIAGVACNSGYVLATRKLAGFEFAADHAALDPGGRRRSPDADPALDLASSPSSLHVWLVMAGLGVFAAAGHGLLIVAHKYRFRPRADAVLLYPARLDDRVRAPGVRRLAADSDAGRRGAGCRLRRVACAARAIGPRRGRVAEAGPSA